MVPGTRADASLRGKVSSEPAAVPTSSPHEGKPHLRKLQESTPKLTVSLHQRPRSPPALPAAQATSPRSKSLFRRLCTKTGGMGSPPKRRRATALSQFSLRNRQPHPPK